MNAPMLRRDQRATQTLTPRLQRAVRLLQLSSLEFAQEVQHAINNNPFLEPEDTDTELAVALPAEASASPSSTGDSTTAQGESELSATPETAPADAPEVSTHWDESEAWTTSPQGSGTRENNDPDGDTDFQAFLPAAPNLRDHLARQLLEMKLSTRDRVLAFTLIDALDDDGYLRLGYDEFSPLVELDPPPTEEEWTVALRWVQSMEPAGVGARDLRECLLLQLAEHCDPRCPPHALDAARLLVDNYLPTLAAREFNVIAKALDITAKQVDVACALIRSLDPRPGWRFGASETRFIVPDVIVKKSTRGWNVSLNPTVVPRVRLNRVYAALFHAHRNATHGDLAAQLQEARWTVRNIEQRFETILRVAETIVARQKQFFEFGPLAMKPMALKEIADPLGLHESTVSRVTNNKYMGTPSGVFELKYFFSRALTTANGGSASATAIRGVIKEMILNERVSAPLSDAQIARLLARQGLNVARRTVTKYRQMMQLPAVELRRHNVSSATAMST